MDEQNSENLNEEMFYRVAQIYGFPKEFAMIHSKMLKQLDLTSAEINISKQVDFSFYALATCIQAASAQAGTWPRMKDTVRQATTLEAKTTSYNLRRYIRELIQNAKDVLVPSEKAIWKLILNKNGFTFSHNGRPFSGEYSGKSKQLGEAYSLFHTSSTTKSLDFSTVGQFGIGFKGWILFCEEILISCSDGSSVTAKIGWKGNETGNVEITQLMRQEGVKERETTFRFTSTEDINWTEIEESLTNDSPKTTIENLIEECMQLISIRDQPVEFVIELNGASSKIEHQISTPRELVDITSPRSWFYECQTSKESENEGKKTIKNSIIELEIIPHSDVNVAIDEWLLRQKEMYKGLANNPFDNDEINVNSWYRSDTEAGQSVRFCICTEDVFEERSWLSNLVPIDHGIGDSDVLISESRWLIDGPFFLSNNRLKLREGSHEGNANIILQSLKRGFSSLCKIFLDKGDLVNYRYLLKLPKSAGNTGIMGKIMCQSNGEKNKIEEIFGEVNNIFRNCNNEVIKNSDVRRIDETWFIGEKSFIEIIEDEYKNGNSELVAKTFPEMPILKDVSDIKIITSEITRIAEHMPLYSSSEMYATMKDSGLIDILAEKHPGIQRVEFILPPIPEKIDRIIFGDSSDEDDLMNALLELQDGHNFKIIADTNDDIYAAYCSKSKITDWIDLELGERKVAIIKAPEDCDSNWMIGKILQCIANSNHSLCNDIINKYHDEINDRCKNQKLDWVSSDVDIYGNGLEESSRMWIKLSYIAEQKRMRSILLSEGSVWYGRWGSCNDWTWLHQEFSQLERVNELENIITSTTFRGGISFSRFDEVALLGGDGLIPSCIIEALKCVIKNVSWSERNYIIFVNIDSSQLNNKLQQSWNVIPRFTINQHVQQIERNSLKEEINPLPVNLDTLKRHIKTERVKSKLLGNIFDLEMKKIYGNVPRILIREFNLLDAISFMRFKQFEMPEFNRRLIHSVHLLHSQKSKLPPLRNYALSVFKSGVNWYAEVRKINNYGLTKEEKNLSHNSGSFEPEDELFDVIRQTDVIFGLGFEEVEEIEVPSFVVSDEKQMLSEIFNHNILGISKTELIRIDECPIVHKQNNFNGIAAIIRHIVTCELDDRTILLAEILCNNIRFAAGVNEDNIPKITEMRANLEDAFTDSIHSQFRDNFLPAIRNTLSQDKYIVLDQLGIVIATSSISKDEIIAEIRTHQYEPCDAWNFYVEKATWLNDVRWFFNNETFSNSRKAFDENVVLLTENQLTELFPHGMHNDSQKRKMTGWRPADRTHICVLPQSLQIDFMLDCPSTPSFTYDFTGSLNLDRYHYELEDEHKSRWSFLTGLIGLYHCIGKGFTEFELAYLEEGALIDECTSYSLGSKPLCLGEHGWDLSRLDDAMAIRTNSPLSPTPQQLYHLKIFIMHMFNINRIQLRDLLLNDSATGNPSLSPENRDKLAEILGTNRKTLDPLLKQMLEIKVDDTFLDFYNPFHISLENGVTSQSERWQDRHGGSSKWPGHVGESLQRDGAIRLFNAYQEAIVSLLRNPIPSDDYQETCTLLKIRKNDRLDRKFELDLYHGFHSMLMDEPRIWTPVDGVAPKMHISKLSNRYSHSTYYQLLVNANLVDFPGNILFVSPFTSHRMSMTASGEGIQRLDDVKFGQINANGSLKDCLFKTHLKSWDDNEQKYVTLKDVMNFNDGTDSTKMSLKVHKFHFVLIAAMDAALREYISDSDITG